MVVFYYTLESLLLQLLKFMNLEAFFPRIKFFYLIEINLEEERLLFDLKVLVQL